MFFVFLNGGFQAEERAMISVQDRGFLYGDGVFTTLKVCEGHVEFFDAHCHKIYRHCNELRIIPPEIRREWVDELIQRQKALRGIWRLKIIVTGGERSSNFETRPHQNFLMTLHPYIDLNKNYLTLKVYPQPFFSPIAHFKSLAYLDRLMMIEHAIKDGYDNVIVYSPEGFLLETSNANIFWVSKQRLYYPEASLPLSFGVTLSKVLEIAPLINLTAHPIKASLKDLESNMHFYASNSMMGLKPIQRIGQQEFCLNESFDLLLQNAFEETKRRD